MCTPAINNPSKKTILKRFASEKTLILFSRAAQFQNRNVSFSPSHF